MDARGYPRKASSQLLKDAVSPRVLAGKYDQADHEEQYALKHWQKQTSDAQDDEYPPNDHCQPPLPYPGHRQDPFLPVFRLICDRPMISSRSSCATVRAPGLHLDEPSGQARTLRVHRRRGSLWESRASDRACLRASEAFEAVMQPRIALWPA